MEGATLTLETSEIKSELVLVPSDKNHPQYKERREKNLKLEVKEIIVPDITLFFQGNPETVASTAKSASTAVSVTTIAVMGANPAVAISMVKVMQCMDLLKIINIPQLPSNFRAFLDLFKNNMFDVMPNLFKKNETDDQLGSSSASASASSGSRRLQAQTDTASDAFSWDLGSSSSNNKYCNLHPKFISIDLNCLLLNNSGEIGFMLIGMLLLKTLLKILVSCMARKRSMEEQEQAQLNAGALE